jgi:hypothetical protein
MLVQNARSIERNVHPVPYPWRTRVFKFSFSEYLYAMVWANLFVLETDVNLDEGEG